VKTRCNTRRVASSDRDGGWTAAVTAAGAPVLHERLDVRTLSRLCRVVDVHPAEDFTGLVDAADSAALHRCV